MAEPERRIVERDKATKNHGDFQCPNLAHF
jgi:hypothetical protein